MRLLTASALFLVLTGTGCDSSTEPPQEHDPQRIIIVRGRVTTDEGVPVDSTQTAVQFATNSADCTGELLGDHVVHPNREGFYQGKAGSPRLLAPQRCVWVRANRMNDRDFEPSGFVGGIPATLRFRRSGVPLDTLTINIVLKRRTP